MSRQADWSRRDSAASAEIGEIPPPANPRRRKAAGKSLLKFLTTYFPDSTGLKPFSGDHKRLIADLEQIIRYGGRRINAVYRGFAKTTITENAALWAAIYGHRQFVLVVGINAHASTGNIDSIKAELSDNDLLAEDFPEVCQPIRHLDGKPQRCAHQTHRGEHTHIVWRADMLVLPTIPGSVASGAIITSRPFAKARGVKYKRRDGIQARPDLVIVDDPQDEESAATRLRVNKNLSILRKGLLQTGAHTKSMAAVVNATIVAHGDMIETLLEDPAWEGVVVPMVKSWSASHDDLWMRDYAAIRRSFDRDTPGDKDRAIKAATAFYRKNRKAMDRGCVVSWKHCYGPGELSAIQHAYNKLIDDGEEAFASEYQGEPLKPGGHGPLVIDAAILAGKLSNLERGRVPKPCQWVSAYIDVHDRLLYWCIAAWAQDFAGGPIDYGTYPAQSQPYFAQATAPIAMRDVHPGMDEDAWLLAGLTATVDGLLGRVFAREDGASMRIGRVLIDAQWGQKTELVKQFCRRHAQGGSIVLPAMGIGFGATRKSFGEYRPEPGATIGLNWRLATQTGGDRVLSIDANWWKTFAATRLLLPPGTPGGWNLFGRDPRAHALFCDHMTAEEPKTVIHKESQRERVVWEWKPGRPDNHWWDCLCGAAVAGSMLGASIPGVEVRQRRRPDERPTLQQMARGA